MLSLEWKMRFKSRSMLLLLSPFQNKRIFLRKWYVRKWNSKKAQLGTEGGLEIIRTRRVLALHQGKLWEGLAHLLLFPYGKKQIKNNHKTTTENKQTRNATLSGRGIPPAHPRARGAPPGPAGRCSAAHRREAPGDNPDAQGPPSRRSGESWPHPIAFPALRPHSRPRRRRAPELCPPGRGALAAGPPVRRGPRVGGPTHPAFGPQPPPRHTARRSRPRGWSRVPRPHSCHRSLTAASPPRRARPGRAGPPLTWVQAATAPTPPGRACATPYHGARTSLIA